MARRRVFDRQSSFAGGLNTTADISQLRPNELRVARNARLTEYGAVLKRRGTQRIHATALESGSPVKTGYYWADADKLLAIANGRLHDANTGLPTTWTARGLANDFSDTVFPDIVAFRDISANVVYIADGGLLNKWNGTTLTLNIAGTPIASRLAVQNNRLFSINGSDQTLQFSGLGNGDTLGDTGNNGGNAIIRTFGQQKLKALLPIANSLAIFHEEGVSRFTGWSIDDFDIDAGTRGISSDTGTIAPRSVVAVENVGFFLSDRGFYAITESGVVPISTNIEADLRPLSQADFDRVTAVHSRRTQEVWFFVPGKGVYVLNYRLRAEKAPFGVWTGPWDGAYLTGLETLFPCNDAADKPIVLMGDSSGFVHHADRDAIYRDNIASDGTGGSSVQMTAQLHRMFFGSHYDTVALRYLYGTLDPRGSTTLGVSWETLRASGQRTWPNLVTFISWNGTTWNGGTWGTGGALNRRVQVHGRGPYIDITVSDSADAEVLFSQIEAEGFLYGRRF